jgi:hypothetical protein
VYHVGVDICNLGGFENLGICTMWVCLKICNLGGLGNLDICITLWVCLTFVNQGVLGTRVYISHSGRA